MSHTDSTRPISTCMAWTCCRTPVFLNPTLLGAMPGYYNSAYGITVTVAPTINTYVSYGIYDGNLARGEQTGLNLTPEFNGYYFMIGEVGYA